MYNSDGYVMIDMSDVDLTRSSQNIPGIYKRVLEVIDTNKLALIVNAGNNTPMAAVVHKKLNYYKITTLLYIFTINTNDIVIVEESGEATVDVEIVPTLTEGTKIADFAIGDVEGSLYAPSQQSEINDNVTAVNSTWSSTKISNELSAKADTGDLAAVAISGSYTDLSNKPTIPVLTDLIDDTSTSQDTVWSSDKTAAEIAAGAGVTIDDTTTSLTKTWSSDKINSEVSAKPSINDTTASGSTVYSSNKVDTLLSGKADTSTTYTKTEVDTALSNYEPKHTTAVYTITEQNVPNLTETSVYSVNLDAGTYIFSASIEFKNNSLANKNINVNLKAGNTLFANGSSVIITSGYYPYINVFGIVTVNANTTFTVNCSHVAGETIKVGGRASAYKIA